MRPDVFFFRDSHGNEVDLIIRQGSSIIPVEVKSAATFSTSFIKGLERFRAAGPNPVQPGVVLYNGQQQFEVNGVRIFNPLQVEDLWQEICGQT